MSCIHRMRFPWPCLDVRWHGAARCTQVAPTDPLASRAVLKCRVPEVAAVWHTVTGSILTTRPRSQGLEPIPVASLLPCIIPCREAPGYVRLEATYALLAQFTDQRRGHRAQTLQANHMPRPHSHRGVPNARRSAKDTDPDTIQIAAPKEGRPRKTRTGRGRALAVTAQSHHRLCCQPQQTPMATPQQAPRQRLPAHRHPVFPLLKSQEPRLPRRGRKPEATQVRALQPQAALPQRH